MIFKPSSLHKLFFTYICPRFYGGAPATPSNTTTTSTVNQSPWQNPIYQALMLGTKDKPGPITSMLRSSAEQTAAYNDMLKGGYSPVPLNQKYDIPKPPTQVPYSRDIPGAEATPAYTLPATATATAPPPGANAIVNGGAKGGIMSLQGYAQGKTAKVVPTIVEKAQTALDSGKKLTPLQTTILQTAADNSAKGGLGTVTVKGNKVTIDPPKRLPNQSSADYEKSLQTFKTAGYDLSPALAKLYPNIKSAAEQKAATSLQNTIGTLVSMPAGITIPNPNINPTNPLYTATGACLYLNQLVANTKEYVVVLTMGYANMSGTGGYVNIAPSTMLNGCPVSNHSLFVFQIDPTNSANLIYKSYIQSSAFGVNAPLFNINTSTDNTYIVLSNETQFVILTWNVSTESYSYSQTYTINEGIGRISMDTQNQLWIHSNTTQNMWVYSLTNSINTVITFSNNVTSVDYSGSNISQNVTVNCYNLIGTRQAHSVTLNVTGPAVFTSTGTTTVNLTTLTTGDSIVNLTINGSGLVNVTPTSIV